MDTDRIDSIVDRHHGDPSSLIQVLLEIQREEQWLSHETLERVSRKFHVPLTRIRHIATFYKAFRLIPKGRHEVHVCMGTACHVRGAPRVLNAVQDFIGIRPGETDSSLTFSLETVNCLGCCALGPVLEIDGKAHGKMSPSDTASLLQSYK